ncbi:acetolactate synthase-1/3 small subunit [Clostridium tetanomorphum]|uniref:Acetolactate synthase small subunit n=1 Tax=Clostridium tetanomorphum TaxID=1553 RepID=A0A923IYH2_CLOTT|nr:acetolactate synthase small subunit [Clostridium tetanomorphum]KAJ51407.1 Acetolactate synthase, small subunit [Clostridium tetanomorphum DSM 665]MBC2396386.1 acetolactate synthase small subunit [Clostridium tetanomorphum]MBP1863384.1 acetolactate synthase-1/3 small subunit [Clostridium tetanomorphum]NRS83481.1 acetolactate synthase-1/3 small subunit [Clostridium tetanomorphum]NRZ96681.1 acetolactate synthase-1/3 small subunit [Clostridium tetanomorphum]
MKSYVLSVIVDNNPGELLRICQLFNRRGYNLESVTAGETERLNISRLTLIVKVEKEEIIHQIIKQIKKLEYVYNVIVLDDKNSICRQMMFIKVKAEGEKKQEVVNIVNIFRGSITDVAADSLTIEITGDENKLEGFKNVLLPFGILEIASSGFIAIERGVPAL